MWQTRRRDYGKIGIRPKVPLKDDYVLSLVYTPGVAEPCRAIAKKINAVYDYTAKGNLVALLSDGSSVLGMGNLGPLAALPVLEGKAVILKNLAGIDAVPLPLAVCGPEEFVATAALLEPTFGGILLDDIAAPACFKIEKALQDATHIPVVHDDQHGTAIVVLAALMNALQVVGKEMTEIRVVVAGTGASGLSVARMLLHMGVSDLILADERGILHEGRQEGMDPTKAEVAYLTNPRHVMGGLAEALRGADVLIGLSIGGIVHPQMIHQMEKNPIVLPLANPDPEIDEEAAHLAGARVVASGRQVTNVLVFPGLMRGCLDVRAATVTPAMRVAAAQVLAGLVDEEELSPRRILPDPLDLRVPPAIAGAVAHQAIVGGVAQLIVNPDEISRRTRQLIYGELP